MPLFLHQGHELGTKDWRGIIGLSFLFSSLYFFTLIDTIYKQMTVEQDRSCNSSIILESGGLVQDILRQSVAASESLEREELDEEQLLRLYTRSASLLPNGERVRNLLLRLDNKRRQRCSNRPIVKQEVEEEEEEAEPQMRMFDLRRCNLTRPNIVEEQQRQCQEFINSASSLLELEVDAEELARPMECWSTQFDSSSLRWTPKNSLVTSGYAPAPTTTSTNGIADQSNFTLPFADAAMLSPPLTAHVQISNAGAVVDDTQFIDARSNTVASNVCHQPDRNGNRMADPNLMKSPRSLLPHWPEQQPEPSPPSNTTTSGK